MKCFKGDKSIKKLAAIICGALFLALLSACGSSSQAVTGDTIGSNSPKNVEIPLKHSPIGTTEFTWESGTLNVKISLTGLAPNSSHAAHIHAGTCAVDGAVIYPLKPVVADAKGDGTSETSIPNVSNGIPAHGWYINVHNGLLMSSIEHRPISCGNVTNSDSSSKQSVRVVMMGTTAPNESARGQADLTFINGKPTLKITLSGLEPNSTHVAHIHGGSCEAQGPVLVMLKPVVANDKGIGTSVTTFDSMPIPKNGLYVNVHTGATMAELAQPTLFNPIACGNVMTSY